MSFVFETIGITGFHRSSKVAQCVIDTIALLKKWQLGVILDQKSADALSLPIPENTTTSDNLENCDLIIAIGGDGNMLSAARTFSLLDIPVIGINRGELGFLTDLSPDTLAESLKAILQGQFKEEQRFLIQGSVQRNGKEVHQFNALNDIVLFPGKHAQLIEFEVSINDQFVYRLRADGLIIATPTGSTAYALSAGGPIIDGQLNTLLLVPKLPHTLSNRPIVIDGDSTISIRLCPANPSHAALSFDGQEHVRLHFEDIITVKRQQRSLRLLHPVDHNPYHVLRNKLQWSQQLIPLKDKI